MIVYILSTVNRKKLSEDKKIWVKDCTKPLLCDANYDRKSKDLYGKPLERDWRAKRLLLIQILLISNALKNSPLKDINLEICM